MRQTGSTSLASLETESLTFHELVLTMGIELRESELNESVQEPVHAVEPLESGHR